MDKKSLQEQFEQTKTYELCKSWQIDFDEKAEIYYSINPAYHNDVIALNAAWSMFQEQQAKVEEQAQEIANLKSLIQGHELRHQQNLSIKQKLTRKSEELQKRVQFLEQELGAWKGKSIAAMINGMCKQCGKEPWQAIFSDKEGYALLHCFGCGANKYELVGEQALKEEG